MRDGIRFHRTTDHWVKAAVSAVIRGAPVTESVRIYMNDPVFVTAEGAVRSIEVAAIRMARQQANIHPGTSVSRFTVGFDDCSASVAAVFAGMSVEERNRWPTQARVV